MNYNFDEKIDRRGTSSLKWEKYGGRDIIPLWVADMDFHSAPAILDALQKRLDHGIFGYTLPPVELNETVVAMLETRFGWKIQQDWLVWLPGLVTGLNIACRAVGEDGDDVLTAVPVYPPFLSAPGHSRRNLIKVSLKEENNKWAFDFDEIERSITPQTKLFILCNPHNPVGRIFTRDELTRLADICQKHNVLVCSDEIHCDLILDKDMQHIPTASLDSEIAARTITLMAPSKTFNVPGLGCSFAVIPDGALRRRFKKTAAGIVPMVNPFGYIAALASYRDCSEWHADLLEYLRGNRDIVAQAIQQMPGFDMAAVEATYLAWIDVRNTGLSDPAKFFEKAGVGLQDGKEFDGPGFLRLNFGCPRSLLVEALLRMGRAIEKPC